MRIGIRVDGVRLPLVMRVSVKRRVELALARFAEHIGRVTTRLWAPQTPTPEGENRCQIEVELKLPKIIKSESSHSKVLEAVDRAAGRLARTIARELTVNQTSPPHPSPERFGPASRRNKESTHAAKTRNR